jgi:two-component system chemotaxis response regulator CheY
MLKKDKKTILVADSNASARKLLVVRLQSLDYETIEAGSIEEARERLASQSFDLVISEEVLPGDGNVEFLDKFQEKGIPVFLLTDQPAGKKSESKPTQPVKEVFHRSQRAEMLLKAGELLGGSKDSAIRDAGPVLQILLIEDSPTIRGFLRRIIGRHFPSWVIREAEDGRQAMSEMSNKKVDFIVTDLQMPGMDGRTFLKILHKNPLLKHKPVLILSGSITEDLKEELKVYSSVRLLAKPSSEEEISRAIRELVEIADPYARFGQRKN